MNPIDYAAELNAEQLAAVHAPDGPVLVIAAAGTGKTRTLVYRVAWLLERGIRGHNLLLLTFTNKAAHEMMERARALAGSAIDGMWGGTFHHVANRMLRVHAERLGYRRDYSILDSDDQKSLCKSVVEELGLKKDKDFPKAEVLLGLFSLAANKGVDPEGLVRERFGQFGGIDIASILRVYQGYEAKKRDLNGMDFDDLLLNAVKLLEEHDGPREQYQYQFRHVLVDEYQDTNPVQSRFVRLLADGSKNLLVVGDDFQSIYGWRGADYRNILQFPQQYPGAHTYHLVTNYRSVPGILRVANKCIAGNPEQFQKELRAVREEGPQPVLAELQDGREQARYVIQKIKEARREGYKLNDIAILYRSHFHAMELQLELNREQMAHVITSGVRFFEQAHIKDVLCLLRLSQNPRDELSFLRVACLLPGVGEKGAGKVWTQLKRRFDPLSSEDRKRLLEAFPKRGRDGWQPIHDQLELVDREELSRDPGGLIQLFLDAFYDQHAVENFDNYPRRLEDIQGLIDYCAQFPHVEAFLNELALQTNLDERSESDEKSADAVRLGTIHQAKGLEFPIVFVIWVVDGMFPSGRALEEDGESGGESEERRLFYVATTRAKDHLFLCAPKMRHQRDGGITWYAPSRFIAELGTDLLRKERGAYY